MNDIFSAIIVWIAVSSLIAVTLDNWFGYKTRLHFVWFDFWIGIYYDREKKIIYINSLPCIVWKCENIMGRLKAEGDKN